MPSSRYFHSLLAAAVAFLAACESNPELLSYETSDSSGVEIVLNSAAAWGEADRAWALSASPVLSIETAEEEGDFVLHEVQAAVFRSDGSLAVGLGSARQVLLFGSDGELRTVFGGLGEGPGEFRWVGSIAVLPGDSMAVFDSFTRRIQIFDSSGRLARALTPEPERAAPWDWEELLPTPSGGFILAFHGRFRAGRVEHGVHRRSVSSFQLSADGATLSEFGPFPGTTQFNGPEGIHNLLGPRVHFGIQGDRLIVGTADDEEFKVFDSEGHLVRIVRWPKEDRTLSRERIEEAIHRSVRESSAEIPPAAVDRILTYSMSLPFPEVFPPYGDLRVSDDGYVWVGEDLWEDRMVPETPHSEQLWRIFDPAGVWLGELQTPKGLEVKDIRAGHVLGVLTDELGVESLRVYELLRGVPRP